MRLIIFEYLYQCVLSRYFQIAMSVCFLLITVITMQTVSIQMDHLLVHVILDILEMELYVKVREQISCNEFHLEHVTRTTCKKFIIFEYMYQSVSSRYFQITMSVYYLLIIVMTTQHVSIRMDHLLVHAILDILEMELYVKVKE